jgi:hypothetical protein
MKTNWSTIGGLILSAALLLPAARAATGYGDSPVFPVDLLTNGCSVSGTVLDGNSGNGLVGALVQLGTYNTISGSGGAYSISSVAAGDYTLTGSKPGYSDAIYSVTVSPGSSLSRLIVLLPTNSVITVTSVNSKYSDSSYYLDGVPFNVSFTANVDWAGHPPGTVQFIAPGKTYTATASGPAVSQTLAMGSDFGPGGQLQVLAESTDGTQSSPKLAGLTVMPNLLAGPLALTLTAVDEGGDFYYESIFNTTVFNEASQTIPGNIPVFGNTAMAMQYLADIDFRVSSAGAANITLKDENNLPEADFGGASFSLSQVSLGGGWEYNPGVGQWQYNNASLGIGGDVSVEQTWPFVVVVGVFPVPMYAKAKAEVSADATLQLLQVSPVSLSGQMNVDPSLRGTLGVGISETASVEGWVEGSASLDLQWPQQPTIKDSSLSVSVGGTVYLFGFDQDFTGHTWQWPQSGSPAIRSLSLSIISKSEPSPLGRGYLNYPASGVFAPGIARPMAFGTGSGGANPEILMSPVIPFCDPNCSSSGTNCYLVFLEDNTNRTSMNRTMAMFSTFNGTLWSMPIALADDGTADFHPRILTFADGSAMAAWENEGKLQPDTATLGDMETNLEISVAWFNPKTGAWLLSQQITTNSYIDRSPKLAGRSTNNILLTWIANPANDANGSSTAPNQIWFAKWNGSVWSVPQLAATISHALVKYDLAYDGTNANLVMSLDTVDNSTNANGHELFRLAYQNGTWGTLTQLTSDQLPDDNPQMSFDLQGNTVLTWLKGAELSSVLNFNMTNRSVVLTNEYSSDLADFKLAGSSDGKLALLWAEPSENDADLFAMFYDPVFQTWGSPRQLTHDPQTERSTTAAFYGTNEVIAVYDRSMVSSTNSVDTTLTDLAAYYYTLGEDLALDGSQFNANPANPTPGSTATLSVEVLNLGDKVETNVVVAFYLNAAQPASQIGRVTLTNAISPQGSNSVTFNWQVPSINSPVTVFAVVDPDQVVPDVNRSNNLAQITLVEPNTEVQSMNWSRVTSNLLAVTVSVVNDGAISNGPTTISLNEDSVTGPNLFSQAIGALAPGQSHEVSFLWNTAGLPDNLNVYAVLSGSGISNNFSAVNTTGALAISQVPSPWIHTFQYLTTGGFQIEFYGTVGHACSLMGSTDLVNWTPVLSFTCTNAPMSIVDPGAKSHGWQFYRVAQ